MFKMDKKESGGAGEGLLVYIKDKWKSACSEDLTKKGFTQSLRCSVNVKAGKLLVGLCYRSPSSKTENKDNLLKLLEPAVQRGVYSSILIVGDFNYPNIEYKLESVRTGPCSAAAKF